MPRWQVLALLDVLDIRTLDGDLAVLDLGHILGNQNFDARGSAAAAFHEQVVLADALALEGGTEGHRDVDLGDADLEAAYLDGLLDDLVVGYVADHVLVGTDAGGQDLGNVVVGDGREAPVDGAGGIGVPFVGDRAEGHNEGEGPVLVVDQVAPVIAGLDAAEGHGHPAGETDGEDRRGIRLPEWHQTGIPADLDIVVHQLVRPYGRRRSDRA